MISRKYRMSLRLVVFSLSNMGTRDSMTAARYFSNRILKNLRQNASNQRIKDWNEQNESVFLCQNADRVKSESSSSFWDCDRVVAFVLGRCFHSFSLHKEKTSTKWNKSIARWQIPVLFIAWLCHHESLCLSSNSAFNLRILYSTFDFVKKRRFNVDHGHILSWKSIETDGDDDRDTDWRWKQTTNQVLP